MIGSEPGNRVWVLNRGNQTRGLGIGRFKIPLLGNSSTVKPVLLSRCWEFVLSGI